MIAINWDEIPRKYYSYEQERETLKWAFKNGMESFVVSYGGVRTVVRHIGETLIDIHPKAKSANPYNAVGVMVVPPEEEGSRLVDLRGQKYEWGNRGASRVVEAIAEVFLVWRENPSRDAVYKVVGGKTHHCAVCGLDLTDPLSVSRGLGPECWTKLWKPEAKRAVRTKRLQEK